MGQSRKVIRNLVPQKSEAGLPSITCLPRDTMLVVASHLPLDALTSLSKTCTGFFHFTRKSTDWRKSLLSAVMAANIERVQVCLKDPSNIPMILKRLSAREFNKREWQSISPLEFAAWAGDQELLLLLLQHVPQIDKPEALEQLEHLVYKKLEHGFALKPYYDLSEDYRVYPRHFGNDIRLEAEGFCIKGIGIRQAKLPSFCLQLFCDGERFTGQSNRSDISYLEIMSEYQNIGISRFINKSNIETYVARFPINITDAGYCENYIVEFCGRHQIFLTQLINQLRLEVPQPEPATKRVRRGST